MIKYDDYIIMINEGLIMTHPLSKCKNIIDFESNKINYWKSINFNDNNTFDIFFAGIPNKNELEYLFNIYNNLGYYISYYKVFNSKKQYKIFPWLDFDKYQKDANNKLEVTLFFESRFDEKLKYVPKKLYHVTDLQNIKKINKKGLIPLYFNNLDFRPDRIYFSLLLKDAENILNKKIFNDKIKNMNNKYIIYEIVTNNINNLVLYKDPRSNGCYTYNHINPKNLKIIK